MPISATTTKTAAPPHLGPEGTYSFSAAPRAQIAQPRRRNRQGFAATGDPMVPGRDTKYLHDNLMYDRRIIRGNTYAQPVLPSGARQDPLEIQRQQEIRRRALAKRKAHEQRRPLTPEAVAGREHMQVQTDAYLFELTAQVEERNVEVQTDETRDRPATPIFIPQKTGLDKSTQIYEGDLFDFEIEVKPLVSVLVAKSMEQALLEVLEEEELLNLRERQREFEELRQAELLEAQRLEEVERRHRQEKENRVAQMVEAERVRLDTSTKVSMLAFATGYVGDLIPSVFGQLNEEGFFHDVAQTDVEVDFYPTLLDQVESLLDEEGVAMDLMEDVVVAAMDAILRGGGDASEDYQQPRDNDDVVDRAPASVGEATRSSATAETRDTMTTAAAAAAADVPPTAAPVPSVTVEPATPRDAPAPDAEPVDPETAPAGDSQAPADGDDDDDSHSATDGPTQPPPARDDDEGKQLFGAEAEETAVETEQAEETAVATDQAETADGETPSGGDQLPEASVEGDGGTHVDAAENTTTEADDENVAERVVDGDDEGESAAELARGDGDVEEPVDVEPADDTGVFE